MINSISNNEAGGSVRAKLNATIAAVQELRAATSDVSRTSGTLADDPVLSATVPASESVLVEYGLVFNLGSTIADNVVMNWAIPTAPSGFTPVWESERLVDASVIELNVRYGTWADYTPTWAAGTVVIRGWLLVSNDSASDASVTLRWANNGGLGTTIRKAGSWLAVRRLR